MQDDERNPRTEIDSKKVDRRAAISVHVVHAAIRREGEDELHRTLLALAWSALAAGMSMGFSLLAEASLAAYLPNTPWRPLVAKTGYAVGFLIVILGRQQLFTENTLIVILPLFEHKDRATFVRVAQLWGVVLSANLVGTLIFTILITKALRFAPDILAALSSAATESLPESFGQTFVRAIFAGWLIALTVWMLPAAESARVSIIFILTYLIGLGGFYHCIAGSVKMLYAVLTGGAGWLDYFFRFLPPVLAGNIVGGVALVAALGHAQVVSGEN